MAFFGKKKKKKKNEEEVKNKEPVKVKKKAGKSKRKPSVVSTKARGSTSRTASSTLRRRGTGRAARKQIRPHFIVDPTSRKLVQVNLPNQGASRKYPEQQDLDSEHVRIPSDRIHLDKTLLRQPRVRRTSGARAQPGLSPYKSRHRRKKSWAEDPTDLDPDNVVSDIPGTERPYKNTTGGRQTKVRSRSRTSDDLQEWLSWRIKVNEQLTSFVIRDREEYTGSMPVGAFPRTLKEDRLNAIFDHAKAHERPGTSLDNLSYMIYGIPRVKLTGIGRRENDFAVRTPSPDYEDTGRHSEKSGYSYGTNGSCDRLDSHELTSSTVLSESDQQVTPPDQRRRRHEEMQRRQAVYRRNGRLSPPQRGSPERRPTEGGWHRPNRGALVRRITAKHMSSTGLHRAARSPSPIYQNAQVIMAHSRQRRYEQAHEPPAQRLRSPSKDRSRTSTPCGLGHCGKPPIAGAVPTVLSLCSLPHGTSQRELRHVSSPRNYAHLKHVPPPEYHVTRARQVIGPQQSEPPHRDARTSQASVQEVYRHYRQQVPRKY